MKKDKDFNQDLKVLVDAEDGQCDKASLNKNEPVDEMDDISLKMKAYYEKMIWQTHLLAFYYCYLNKQTKSKNDDLVA